MIRKKLSLQDILYKIGTWGLFPVLLIGVWFSKVGYHYTESLTRCGLREQTGLPCAGCGGTRAVILLFRGEFWGSFVYHPAVITAVTLYIHFICKYFYRKKISHKVYAKEIPIAIYAYILAGVIIVQWVIKLALIFYRAG